MFENIKADSRRYLQIDGREHQSLPGRLFVLFFAYGLQATVVYRFGQWIDQYRYKNGFMFLLWYLFNPLYLFASFCTKKLFGIHISRSANIAKGFYVGHFGGIEIGNCSIGEICNVHQLAKIRDGSVIGNYVWVGGHATIENDVVVEDNATVTVAARVNKTVYSYSLVSGSPARSIKINFDNRSMLGIDS